MAVKSRVNSIRHSRFQKRISPGIFKGPCQTIAIARGTVLGSNSLQYPLYESRSGQTRREPIGVPVSKDGETETQLQRRGPA
jgi:hypothetical protein